MAKKATTKRTPKKHQKRLVKDDKVRVLLARMLTCKETGSVLKAILFAQERDVWRGVVATPPASLLEVVLAEFMRATPVAAELPFMSCVCLIAQMLCERGAALVMNDGQKIRPDLYTVLLADSGEMKTWSLGKLLKAFEMGGWQPNELDDAGSTAGLEEGLQENQGKQVIWLLDEFGKFWEQTKTEVHQRTPRVLLMAYDHSTITKRLKNSQLEIKDPCMSLLGVTVAKTIHEKLTAEDWASGLCQRIAFVFAPKDTDPERNPFNREFAILDGINLERITAAFRKANQTPVHTDYRLTSDARSAIGDAWVLMGKQGITQDFVRRIEFRIFKYALVYHWLLGKASNEIDKEDVNWAFRLAMLHVADLRKILDEKEYADLQDLLRRAEGLRLKFGDKLEPRHVLMFMYRQLKTMPAAEALYSLLVDKEKAALAKANGVTLLADGENGSRQLNAQATTGDSGAGGLA
jgi:hypothetical protein